MNDYQWRLAVATDAERIAQLHVTSWRATYRAIMQASYLAGDIEQERLAVWRERLAQPNPLRVVWLAEQGAHLCGFSCIELDAEAPWGALLDNLHVAPDLHGSGLGSKLMRRSAHWVLAQRPDCGMFLWVFAGNPKARAFYEHLGGVCVEDTVKDTPDGGRAATHRMAWSPAALRQLAGAP